MIPIRTLLTLRLLIGGGLLLGAAGIALHWQMRQALTAEFDATLRVTSQSLATLTEQKRGAINFEFAGEVMPQFERSNGSDFFLLRMLDGHEVERSQSLGDAALPMRSGPPKTPDYFDITLSDGRVMRCVSLHFTPQDGGEDDEKKASSVMPLEAVLIVGRDRAPLNHALAALRTGLLAIGASALTVLAVLVRWGVRSGLGPLDRLGLSVASVDAASLDTRFATGSIPTELRPIATRLNELLARLESTFARERRFTGSAAHELRTPLAELRALAEINLTTPATTASYWAQACDPSKSFLNMKTSLLVHPCPPPSGLVAGHGDLRRVDRCHRREGRGGKLCSSCS